MKPLRVEDESFLADLTGFLSECGDAEPLAALLSPRDAAHDATDLLLESNQLLAETEALLSSCDSSRALANSVSSTTTTVAESPKTVDERRAIKNAQAAKRRLKYQRKLKNERQTLQEQEQILTDELSHLQHTRKKAKPLQGENASVSVWKTAATRQMEGRLVAEGQQRRLEKAVTDRNAVISEISGMVRQRLYGPSTSMLCADPMPAADKSVQLNADDKALFEGYLQELDVVYTRTDEVFRACGVENHPVISYRVGPELKCHGGLEYIDNLDVLLIPFTFEQTCSAMWQSMVHVHGQRGRSRYSDVVDSENTIAVKFRLRCPREQGSPVNMMVHFAMRRYLEAERMVLVWRALSDGEGEFFGMHSDETGWSVVRPNDGADELLLRTIMQTFLRFTLMNIPIKSADKVNADKFAKLVVTSVDEDAVEIARMMDSLLLVDSSDQDIVLTAAAMTS